MLISARRENGFFNQVFAEGPIIRRTGLCWNFFLEPLALKGCSKPHRVVQRSHRLSCDLKKTAEFSPSLMIHIHISRPKIQTHKSGPLFGPSNEFHSFHIPLLGSVGYKTQRDDLERKLPVTTGLRQFVSLVLLLFNGNPS